jgi:hypothetical protein
MPSLIGTLREPESRELDSGSSVWFMLCRLFGHLFSMMVRLTKHTTMTLPHNTHRQLQFLNYGHISRALAT